MLSADHGLLQCESRRDGKLRLVMGDWPADVSEQEGPGSARRSGGAGTIVSLEGLERI